MQTRPNGVLLINRQIRRPNENAVFSKLRARARLSRFLALIWFGINGVVERPHPPVLHRVPRLARIVTDGWNDEKLARPGGRYVGQSNPFSPVPRQLEFTV